MTLGSLPWSASAKSSSIRDSTSGEGSLARAARAACLSSGLASRATLSSSFWAFIPSILAMALHPAARIFESVSVVSFLPKAPASLSLRVTRLSKATMRVCVSKPRSATISRSLGSRDRIPNEVAVSIAALRRSPKLLKSDPQWGLSAAMATLPSRSKRGRHRPTTGSRPEGLAQFRKWERASRRSSTGDDFSEANSAIARALASVPRRLCAARARS